LSNGYRVADDSGVERFILRDEDITASRPTCGSFGKNIAFEEIIDNTSNPNSPNLRSVIPDPSNSLYAYL
jgi:hypothetical protein